MTSSKSSSYIEKRNALQAVDAVTLFFKQRVTDDTEMLRAIRSRWDELDKEIAVIHNGFNNIGMRSSWYRGKVHISGYLSVAVHNWKGNTGNPNNTGWNGTFWSWPYHEYRRGFEAWLHYQHDDPKGNYELIDPHSHGTRYVTSRKYRKRIIQKLIRGPIQKLLGKFAGVRICTTCGVYFPECHVGEPWKWHAQWYDGGTHRSKPFAKLTARETERLLILKRAGAVRLSARGLPEQKHRSMGENHGTSNGLSLN